MKTHLRIIGDVHGHTERYLRLLRKSQYSIQVGDLAFDYTFLSGTDPTQHKFVGGNHDNYNKIQACPNYLGDYGTRSVPGFGDIFFVRGAFSIDWHLRIEGVSWWKDEELTLVEGYAALAAYKECKPNVVITHDCPLSVLPEITMSNWIKKSRTQQLLQAMLEVHKPKLWVFGHYHRSWKAQIGPTKFVCLNELECLDLPGVCRD